MVKIEKKNKVKELGIEEGDLWVSNIVGAPAFTAPAIDAALIGKQLENHYIKSGLDKMQRILFQDDIIIRGYDIKAGKEDPDLTAALVDMCSAEGVELDYAIQRRWLDTTRWGPSLVNPVWGYEGKEYRLLKLNCLPPETFNTAGSNWSSIKNRILPGICYNPDTKEVEFWQKQSTGSVKQLKNVHMLSDPLSSEVGGTPFILPLVPVITALGFSWHKGLAQVNIYGTGGIGFIRVTNPKGDDKEYAQKILNNESSTNRYQLRENMEFVPMGVGPNGSALDTITELGMIVRRFFSPSDLLSKEGDQIIGGSSGPEYQLYMSFIRAQHRWLERSNVRVLQPYLIYNGYDVKKYRIEIEIPDPEVDEREINLKQADTGAKYGGITYDEFRARLGEPPLPNGEGKKLMESSAPSTALQKAEAAAKFIHPIDPYGVIDRKGQKKFVQKTLGIEEGETE